MLAKEPMFKFGSHGHYSAGAAMDCGEILGRRIDRDHRVGPRSQLATQGAKQPRLATLERFAGDIREDTLAQILKVPPVHVSRVRDGAENRLVEAADGVVDQALDLRGAIGSLGGELLQCDHSAAAGRLREDCPLVLHGLQLRAALFLSDLALRASHLLAQRHRLQTVIVTVWIERIQCCCETVEGSLQRSEFGGCVGSVDISHRAGSIRAAHASSLDGHLNLETLGSLLVIGKDDTGALQLSVVLCPAAGIAGEALHLLFLELMEGCYACLRLFGIKRLRPLILRNDLLPQLLTEFQRVSGILRRLIVGLGRLPGLLDMIFGFLGKSLLICEIQCPLGQSSLLLILRDELLNRVDLFAVTFRPNDPGKHGDAGTYRMKSIHLHLFSLQLRYARLQRLPIAVDLIQLLVGVYCVVQPLFVLLQHHIFLLVRRVAEHPGLRSGWREQLQHSLLFFNRSVEALRKIVGSFGSLVQN